ncbi:tetratricopeptide repeat protein [Niabella beijingensis]|uniref:tetratricopeptide repeat protein n=1 Tax=Niabella beijingensis TaxID=2872700 RepID=UPI001CBCD5AA|nr:tetratricopeptide repeat protein [Niabella beijingensis]MBZ4191259.1 tetratricopeptide repeat protein [Niabella beijingensis]
MADKRNEEAVNEHIADSNAVDGLRVFWLKHSKKIAAVLGLIVVLGGGYMLYKAFVQKPKIEEALDKSFKAESFFRKDSFNLALNGDGVSPGFITIAKKYSGTPTGNLAKFYAGVCYVKLNQNDKAISYLKDFKTDSKQIQQRAYKLLGDAYGDMGKGAEALDNYKKAAHEFESDQMASADALFSAAYLAQHVLNNKNEAISLYKELKEKFPRTQPGFDADKYLAQLGVYNVN